MGANYRSLRLRNKSASGALWRLLLVLTAIAGGCGPLPRPFQHVEPEPLSRLEYVSGIIVAPVLGINGDMAGALADSLGRAGIPATVSAGSESAMRLHGHLSEFSSEGGLSRFALQWELLDAGGISLAIKHQSAAIPQTEWNRLPTGRLRHLADEAAAMLSPVMLGEDAAAEPAKEKVAAKPSAPPPPRLAVLGVKGAPGDGNFSLAKGLEKVLRGMGFRLVPAAEADLGIMAQVEMSNRGNAQHISISWRVGGKDNSEIATILQENDIPSGSLSGKWGGTAEDIAEAAAEGLLEIIRKSNKSR